MAKTELRAPSVGVLKRVVLGRAFSSSRLEHTLLPKVLALPVFASAVLVAHLTGANPESSASAAVLWVVARVLHAVTYLANIDWGRSLAFLVGMGANVWLFVLAARA